MSFGVGNALSLIGGAPLQQVRTVFAEKLRIAKAMQMPVSGMLQQLLSGGEGLSSIMQNPVAAITSQVNTALNEVKQQINGALGSVLGTDGASALNSVLSQATTFANALGGAATSFNALAGMSQPGDGQNGLMDAVAHAAMAKDMFGEALPANLSAEAALRPLHMAANLEELRVRLPEIVDDLLNSRITVEEAIEEIMALIEGDPETALEESDYAINTLRALLPQAATVQTAAAALVVVPESVRPALRQLFKPAALAMVDAAIASQTAQPIPADEFEAPPVVPG